MKHLKSVSLALVLCMLTALFTGCGPAPVSGTSSAQPSSSSASSSGEKVELSFLYWADGVQKTLIENACAAYEKQTGVKINAEALPADESFETYIQTRKESGNLPDVSYMGETDVMKYNEMGILADISDVISSGKIKAKLDAVTIKTKDGKTLGVGLSNQLVLLYYNKDMFDKAGIAYPPTSVDKAWDWNQFVDVAKKLTVDTNGKNAAESGFDPKSIKTYGMGFNSLRDFHQFWAMYANGGGLVSADGKSFLWDKAESAEGLQNLCDLVYKDHVASTALYTFNSAVGSVDAAIGGGGYAMYTNGSWDLANLPNVKGVHVGVAVLPKMKNAVTMNCGAPMVVYNTSKHLKEAKDFYAYMVDPEKNLDLLKTGAWLPNEAAWYTDKTLVDKWTASLPKDAVETILSYSTAKGAIAQWPAYYVPAYKKMNTEYEKFIDKALSGEKPVKDVFAECMPKIKDLFNTGTVE